KAAPEQMESFTFTDPMTVVDVMVAAGLAPSKGEARRLIQGGGVSIDGNKIGDQNAACDVAGEAVLKVGKRRFVRLVRSAGNGEHA
ncbi:MAG: tyrosine--tRNA ligase, partial [Chlorobi bacterium CHB2]|nr:tyrosine--tRNA ligase [Chlorobi bacterium CHB2]